ncbi:MAG: dienelactone hydrolase family protein [Ilumatobacter sp.]|nr:dienelactone hydrolase family protein [Ilumatobacter sp.]
MVEAEIVVQTGEGDMGTFVVHPDGATLAPMVIFLMDAPGKRPLLHDMARRLAGNGYYVMLPNLYYRTTSAFELDFLSKESFEHMVELMSNIGNRAVARDVGALLAQAHLDGAADETTVGCVGYCMSGPFALWAAAEHADVMRAAASFYGVRLHVDADDSPHTRLDSVAGELYISAAEYDDYVPLEMVDRFEAAMQDTDVAGRVERYWGTHHGFAFDDRPAYNRRADNRHWAAMLDLFDRNLRS